MSHRWILCSALTPLLGLPALAQSVISAHSGLVHYFDGSVLLDDQRLEQKTGKFDQINNGSELRTQDGRAEVLLTPGTFLRMGANSSIRMLSNKLEDTRVELLSGSAVVDQGADALADTSVTLLYNLDQVRIKKAGRYRFDTAPPQVRVESGDVEVTADGKTIEAGQGFVVPFEGKLIARKVLSEPAASKSDDLDDWNTSRDNVVAENNTAAAGASDLSGVIDGWNNNPDSVLQSLGIPPYIPGMSAMIPPLGYGSGLYGYGYGYPYGPGVYGSTFLYGSALYPYSLYGLGAIRPPLYLYGTPLYRSYGTRLPATYPYYRSLPTAPGRGGYGLYPSRSTVTVHPGAMPAGRIGAGAVHVGGHR